MRLSITADRTTDYASGKAAAADPSPVFTWPDRLASRSVPNAGQEKVTLSAFGVGLSEASKLAKEQVLPSDALSCEQPKSADQFMFTIISKGRSANVPAIERLFENTGTCPVWIVGDGEKADYMGNGATFVHEGGKL
eukprot:COSAG02_NODE_4199_length_5633_cov_4.504518_3_plen_137_part_00